MRHSRATKGRNEGVKELKENAGKPNMQFFADAFAGIRKAEPRHSGLLIGLLGERDIPGVSLRHAQAVLRWDMRPSLWSHAFLIDGDLRSNVKEVTQTRIWEVPLWPRVRDFPKPEHNGVIQATLGQYDDPKLDANVAVLSVKMSAKEAARVRQRAGEFNFDRVRYDLWNTLGVWNSYLWSRGARPNPLQSDVPIASSSYVEMAFEAIQLDLTPGANARNSAPEHLWNAAVWWNEGFTAVGRAIRGFYVLRDKGCSLLGTDE